MSDKHSLTLFLESKPRGFNQIEFLRIIGCIAIVLLHFCYGNGLGEFAGDDKFFRKAMSMTSSGQKAVDLFFIISGFFFAWTLNTEKTLCEFLQKKLIRLYPPFVFSILLFVIGAITAGIPFTFYQNIMDLLILNGTPLSIHKGNGIVFWYVSTLLWITTLFFYCRKHFSKPAVDLFIAAASFFSYAFIIHAKDGIINNHLQTFGYVFSCSMLRGFGGLGLGYFIGEWYKKYQQQISNLHFSWKFKAVFTVLEFICLYFIINNLMLHRPRFHNHLLFVISFAAIIILFLLKQGYISKLLERRIWIFLSRYTYSIYVTHYFVRDLFKFTIWRHHKDFVLACPPLSLAIPVIISIVLGVVTYHLIEKPMINILTDLINKWKTGNNSSL